MPKTLLDQAGLAIDSAIEMTVDGSSIILAKINRHPREGWADDAALVANDSEDHAWLDADLDAASRILKTLQAMCAP